MRVAAKKISGDSVGDDPSIVCSPGLRETPVVFRDCGNGVSAGENGSLETFHARSLYLKIPSGKRIGLLFGATA